MRLIRSDCQKLAVLAVSLVAVAGCGAVADRAPSGPYASPEKSAPDAVAQRGCSPDHPATDTELDLLRTQLIRQGTDLQRIDDDLTGAVPGGDLPTDTDLLVKQAQQMVDLVATTTVCPALKEPVGTRLRTLLQADTDTYRAVRSGGEVGTALTGARAAFNDLQGFLRR